MNVPLFAFQILHALRRYRRRARLHGIIRRKRLTAWLATDRREADARARDLVRRAEAAASWIPSPIYPTGGAAGPLLLYMLIRVLEELDVANVLELGAGQTTKVLDAWATRRGRNVVTFEHDASWATTVLNQVDREHVAVLQLPLTDYAIGDDHTQWYSPPPENVMPEGGFDLLLVDGPVGVERLSRSGIVPHVPGWMNEEWAILWDDLDRPGDLESFALLIDRLRSLNVDHDHVLIEGDRIIGLVFTRKYSALKHMW